MDRLAKEFAETASFFTVWVREAHAGGNYTQPENIETRRQYAQDFCAADDAEIPVIVDDMEGTLHRQLGFFPNSVYIIDGRGHVAYRAAWTDHREVRRVLERLRASAQRFERKVNAGMPVWSEEMLRSVPDDPDAAAVQAITTWEEAENYEEPERFAGERAEAMRATYERVTGKTSVRPQPTPAGDD